MSCKNNTGPADNEHQLPIETTVLLTTGVLLNGLLSYYVFYWKRFQWSCYKLMQNIVICNFIHIIIGGTYELLNMDRIKSLLCHQDDCRLLFPIFTVTVNNPNLTSIAIFAFFLYNTRVGLKAWEMSVSTVKALLVVGWIFCLFLFAPQVFVKDLTQTHQTCQTPHIIQIVDIRVSFWIGILYFQMNVVIITCIYLYIYWRSSNNKENVESSTTATLLKSKYFIDVIEDGGRGNREMELGETRRQRTERFVMNQDRRTVTFSDVSDSGSSPSFPLDSKFNQRCVRVMMQKQRKMLRVIFVLLVIHIVGLAPNNYFFFWYYFNRIDNVQLRAQNIYNITSSLSFVSTVLSPLAFILMHKRIWMHCWFAIIGRHNLNHRKLIDRRNAANERCKVSRNGGGILKETGF